jgi:serine/threonine protein kinase
MNFRVVGLRQLDSGGNGDIFIGQRNDTGEYVVVKFLREWRLQFARDCFEREIRLLGRGVDGLVPLLGWDMSAEPPFYVMPYHEGGALTRYAGRLSKIQLHNVAAQLARTLANLHAAFEVDGDFKPDNVLLARNGELQVGDPLGNGTFFTILFGKNRGGTPGYWAPEIRRGGDISRAGDSYSYGATLYHLLTGRRPVDGQRLDPISEGHTNTPKICEIIAACCQFEPSARPTMQEVLRMLAGEKWVDIQAERKRSQELAGAACFIGALVLVVTLSSSLSKLKR